jgi:SAM-dependent methyltransferase
MSSSTQPHSASQEQVFLEKEADAWFTRNAAVAIKPVSADHRVLQALTNVAISEEGTMLDIGGAAGQLSAGFLTAHPGWTAYVVEPSASAIASGKKAFPQLEFMQGSIAQAEGMPWTGVDMVVVSGVFAWVDRLLLSRAVANVDSALKDGGLLVISDFDPSFLRANPYKHHPGLFTYKQDYADVFKALGIYHLLYRKSENLEMHSASDTSDLYDRQWVTTVLQKDLQGRYYKAC